MGHAYRATSDPESQQAMGNSPGERNDNRSDHPSIPGCSTNARDSGLFDSVRIERATATTTGVRGLFNPAVGVSATHR